MRLEIECFLVTSSKTLNHDKRSLLNKTGRHFFVSRVWSNVSAGDRESITEELNVF